MILAKADSRIAKSYDAFHIDDAHEKELILELRNRLALTATATAYLPFLM